jgi:predicted ferric reductase
VLSILISSAYLYRKTTGAHLASLAADPKTMNIEELKLTLRKAPPSGIVLFYVVAAYSLLRFFNEFFRAEGTFLYGPFKISHLMLALIVIVSAAGICHVMRISSKKEELLKALKGAVTRLFIWLVAWLVAILSLLSVYNFKHPDHEKYIPDTKVNIPEVKQPVPVR